MQDAHPDAGVRPVLAGTVSRWVGFDVALVGAPQLVVADAHWFGKVLTSGHEIKVNRPALDANSAPKSNCTVTSYEDDPDTHRWCCRPHEVAEAEWSDTLAERRARGELNPQTWPPLIDEDRFDVGAADETNEDVAPVPVPENLTLDDLGD